MDPRSNRIPTRPPSTQPAPVADPDTASFLDDAAHYPGGFASGVVRARDVGEVSALLREGKHILPIGAQSSLTGGATPFGDVVLGTERLAHIEHQGDHVRVGAGVTLQAVQDDLALTDRWLPPVPTYLGACAGGAVATCAAGAATFKYGTMRDWIDGLTIVLAGGDVLDIHRGEHHAGADGRFVIATSTGNRVVQVPRIHMPDVPKRSAGYHCAPGMDLVDLGAAFGRHGKPQRTRPARDAFPGLAHDEMIVAARPHHTVRAGPYTTEAQRRQPQAVKGNGALEVAHLDRGAGEGGARPHQVSGSPSARSSSRRTIRETLEPKRVRKVASSTAESPPPTTAMCCSRKKKPSQVAQ